ncbi:MAG: FAD-dependent oxidoreductase [Lysobacterales bacterium]|nr:FAD-dependent oxidoreductase [Rhodanobacteraceae bacterium]
MNLPMAILGAGIAGASAARELHRRGFSVRVFDKGRNPGGRAATRTREGAHFDHGAQYFTARDPRFLEQVQAWRTSGVVQAWQPRLASIDAKGVQRLDSREIRWVGVPGMRELATDLLQGIDLECSQRVVRVEYSARGWLLHLKDASTRGPFSALLCTLPPAQAVELLPLESVVEPARAVQFGPCWALMLSFAEALPVDFDAAFINDGPLSWIARDSSKPGRPLGERWLVHAGPVFSRETFDLPPAEVEARLLSAFHSTLGSAPVDPARSALHRWGYALAQPPLELGIIADEARRIALGGDWCHGSRIEGAWMSGLLLAQWASKLA